MDSLKLFSKYAPNKTFIAIILGSLSGLLYAMLIPVVMRSLTISEQYVVEDKLVEIFGLKVVNSQFAILFFVCCILIMLCRTGSSVLLSRLALDIRMTLRRDLYSQIRRSSILNIEKVGEPRLIQALSTDINAVVMGAQLFPQLLTNMVTLIGMLAYLAYLDVHTFIFVIEIIAFGIISYQLPAYFGARCYRAAREHKDVLQQSFSGLVHGAKELKLSVAKQQNFERELLVNEEQQMVKLEKRGLTIYSLANNYGGLLCFFAIGGLAFVFLNYYPISNMQVIAAVMVLLYVTGPVSMLLNFIPQLANTQISLNKLNFLYKQIPVESGSHEVSKVANWQRLSFKDIRFNHQSLDNDSEGFSVGPLSFAIERSQVTFITGGNGSGKSTMAKVLSQHYQPSAGEVYFDNQLIDGSNINSFRDEIFCIYSDYYLFDRPLGFQSDDSEMQQKVDHYLNEFGLKDKVNLSGGRFSTLKLSDGQRRRLALVVAIIENKSMYLFDEWAADQDPQFKYIFYHQILADLKAQGKAVVVISHDDRYFNVADQLLVMESGQLVDVKQSTHQAKTNVTTKPESYEKSSNDKPGQVAQFGVLN